MAPAAPPPCFPVIPYPCPLSPSVQGLTTLSQYRWGSRMAPASSPTTALLSPQRDRSTSVTTSVARVCWRGRGKGQAGGGGGGVGGRLGWGGAGWSDQMNIMMNIIICPATGMWDTLIAALHAKNRVTALTPPFPRCTQPQDPVCMSVARKAHLLLHQRNRAGRCRT